MPFIFDVFPVLFLLVFALIFGCIVMTLVQKSRESRKNNNSPRVTSQSEVVTKRTQVRGDHAHTTYFATFQFESGDRLELEVPSSHFGYLVEGDKGKLTFQGTRFLDFQRS